MKIASNKDKIKVASILVQSFSDNPTLSFMVGDKHNRKKRLQAIANYAFDYGFKRKGVFLSTNEKGAAICFHFNSKKNDLSDIVLLCKMIWSGFDFYKFFDIANHVKYIRDQRPASGDYLYFWFFGVDLQEHPRVSAKELSKDIFLKSLKKQLDIYAETTIKRNMIVYGRMGFKVYKTWYNPKNGITVWFMKRPYTQGLSIAKRKEEMINQEANLPYS
jgi:hypothetical protein